MHCRRSRPCWRDRSRRHRPQPRPRFYVDSQKGTGILSQLDNSAADRRRITWLNADGSSAERMGITFCYTDGCERANHRCPHCAGRRQRHTAYCSLYPTNNGTLVNPSAAPIVANPGGTNPAGITATYSGGTATILISSAYLDQWGQANLAGAPFNGFQIGVGSANLQFTFRSADVSMVARRRRPPRISSISAAGSISRRLAFPRNSRRSCRRPARPSSVPRTTTALSLPAAARSTGRREDAADSSATRSSAGFRVCSAARTGSPTAQTRKISIDQNGIVTLTCEYTPP